MSIILAIPIKDASPEAIQDIQKKYPHATLQVVSTAEDENDMSEDKFWEIIDVLDWENEDSNAILSPAIEALSNFSENGIFKFHNLLAEKLHQLDQQKYAEQTEFNRYGNGHFSVDIFLYARCCVVANGKIFYEKVLSNPSKMPKNLTFEALLSLPQLAFQKKTGSNHYPHFPETWIETFSNSEGWPDHESPLETLMSL